MRIVSVNVGRPRTVTWYGRPVTTAIFKEPVAGRVPVRRLDPLSWRPEPPRTSGSGSPKGLRSAGRAVARATSAST
jgi:MOSC domain-containing protein YiiM